MKALVLCGGLPQIALLDDLRSRGITTVLADMNEKVAARAHADIFYPVSVLDVEAVKDVAVKEKVDFLITVCADQVLQVVAEVSECLGLPCYIDFATAENVSKKSYMKKIFVENGVPTSRFIITECYDAEKTKHLCYPLIVKPVDSYSSRGVRKVTSEEELRAAIEDAVKISRTKTAIVEEFVEGDEITVDIYVEEGQAHVLCTSNLYKIGEGGKFVIHRSRHPAAISEDTLQKIKDAAQRIAEAFRLYNTPMLIQLIAAKDRISVIEFCARTGGGIKFKMIKHATGFDVVKAVVDLTLGLKPHVEIKEPKNKYFINEFLYAKPGIFDHLEGFDALLAEGVIAEYNQFKAKGTRVGDTNCSGDRIAYFSVQGASPEEILRKHALAYERVRVISTEGEDLTRHDIAAKKF